MFSISKFCKATSSLMIHGRYKSKTHWAKLRRKTGPKYKALNHFDDFYGSVFGNKWETMRAALLRTSKYVAVINNYGDPEKTIEQLSRRGAHCLKNLMTIQMQFHADYSPNLKVELQQSGGKLEHFVHKVQGDDIDSIYPHTAHKPNKVDTSDITLVANVENANLKEEKKTVPANLTLEESLKKAELDDSRIIDPSYGLSSEVLWQYIPATKLKGMDEWVPESLHYSYYSKGKDFPLTVEPETEFTFPEHLKVLTYELDSQYNTFPEPRKCQTGVYNYYPMDCGSVLTVLALCLSPGDRVLDLCSAPGGKSLVALQTLLPDVVVCNDLSLSRCNRIHRVMRDYLYDFEESNKWRERVLLTQVDGRTYKDEQGFDKVLVDVPCTTDRHSLLENDNNIFKPERIKERLKIPELQSELLSNALSLVKPGGAVVYSTCTLSPIQNDGVVHMALKHAFETKGIVATVRDLTACMSGFSSTLMLGTGAAAPRYGQLVTPHVGANFGPTYFSRLVRTQ